MPEEVGPIFASDGALPARPSGAHASGDVIRSLKNLILEGQLVPGQKLPNERDLAEQFNVSRSSLREGIRALAAMNVLTVRHGDGTYVSSLDAELLSEPLHFVLAINASAIFDLFEVRRITEPAVAALAARRATDDELGALQREMTRAQASTLDAEALIDHDMKLHTLVHRAAHNPILLSTSASLAGISHRARVRATQLPENTRMTITEHAAVVQAIVDRDPAEAAAAMLRHVRRLEEQIRQDEAAAVDAANLKRLAV
jgi:GntR family transcriptional repressor for pyruvate dehydrogenase complex